MDLSEMRATRLTEALATIEKGVEGLVWLADDAEEITDNQPEAREVFSIANDAWTNLANLIDAIRDAMHRLPDINFNYVV